jgi:hypothetical protein
MSRPPIREPEGVREWDLFHAGGLYLLGTVERAGDFEVLEIAGSRVWALMRDEFDVG